MMVEKYKIRTDLAMEQKERFESDHVEVSGVVLEEEYDEEKEIKITTVRIETENGAKAMGKPVGTYLTLEAPNMAAADEGYHREISETLAGFLEKYMKDTEENQEKGYSVLVVGLGNRYQTYCAGIWKVCSGKRRKQDCKCDRSGSDGTDRDGVCRNYTGNSK